MRAVTNRFTAFLNVIHKIVANEVDKEAGIPYSCLIECLQAGAELHLFCDVE
jgi:hypothetical protein